MGDINRKNVDPMDGIDSVTDSVIIDFIERRNKGIEKYGTELKTFNGRNTLLDALQEHFDLLVYLKQLELEMNKVYEKLRLKELGFENIFEFFNFIIRSRDSNVVRSYEEMSSLASENWLDISINIVGYRK